jgi:ABC-2 type transport system ATP-binding protein
MHSVSGHIQRFRGRIDVGGKGRVVLLPDRPYLYETLRIDGCLRLFAGRDSGFRLEVARSGLERLGLKGDLRIGELSKGMSEQVHLLLTLCQGAELYLLDEPLASVDPLAREVMSDLIRSVREPGSAVVISTHIISDVEDLFDEVIVLNEGKVLGTGNVEDFRTASVTLEERFKEMLRK